MFLHHNKTKIIFILLINFLIVKVNSQNYSLDSIKNILETSMHDTSRLVQISYILENENQRDSISIHYNKEVIAILAKNLKSNELDFKLRNKYLYYLAYWYADKAVVLSSNQSGEDVIDFIEKSTTIFRYLNMQEEAWIGVNNKGNALRKMGEYEKAIVCFFEALKYHEFNKNETAIAGSNASIGAVYLDQNKYKESITYYNKALVYFNSLKEPQNKDLYEQAIINHNLGVCYFLLNDFKNAKIYLNKALVIERENEFLDNISFVYNRLADVYIKESDFKSAFKLYNEGLAFAKKDRAKAKLTNSLGELFLIKKENSKAINYFNQSLNYANTAKDLILIETIYFNLYLAYKKTNQFDKSLQAYEKYFDLSKLNNAESTKNELAQQQLKYNFEKKEFQTKLAQEKQISTLKLDNEKKNTRKNIILYILISTALILVISLYYLYKYYKQKNIISANKNNELKQKLLLSQMNPHFIFNSVDNIQSLIHNNQNKEAINYLTKFSKLTRQILQNSTENYISLEEELTMLDNYLTIQMLLYNNNFTFKIIVDDSIDTENLLIPPMLTQPFIENAIKHGLKNKADNGNVRVEFYLKNNLLYFEVIDNGSGLEKKQDNAEHKSLATQIVKERLNSNSPKKPIEIKIDNMFENNKVVGVRTMFEIPYIYNN